MNAECRVKNAELKPKNVDKWKSFPRWREVKREQPGSLIKADYVIEPLSGALLIFDRLLHNRIRSDRHAPGHHKDELNTVWVLSNGRYFKGF